MRLLSVLIFAGILSNAFDGLCQTRKQIYDSTLIGDRITPTVSTILMPRGYLEVVLSTSLLSTNSFYSNTWENLIDVKRTSFIFSTLQTTFGISKSGRLNLGVDVAYGRGRTDIDPSSSAVKVLGSSPDGLVNFGRGFTSFAPRIRYVPFHKVRNFVIQQSFSIPFPHTSDTSRLLNDYSKKFDTQFLYTLMFARKSFIFAQTDILLRFRNKDSSGGLAVPLNLYYSYILSRHIFPFVTGGMNLYYTYPSGSAGLKLTGQGYTYGIGVQFQFSTLFNVNTYYSDVFAGKNYYRYGSFNLGIRVVI